jgi:hypothetical protein
MLETLACQMFMPATGRLSHERIHGVWRVRKTPGYSFLDQTSGACHRFIAQDESHPSSDQIYTMPSFYSNPNGKEVYFMKLVKSIVCVK